MQAREVIMSALFELVSNSSAFVTASRRLRLWNEVPSAERPALFMFERGDEYKGAERFTPPIVTMNVDIFIYIDAGKDQSAVPAMELNRLIDAIDAVMAPSPSTGKQTLGGLVSHCWIDGKVTKDPGDLDGDGLALIPIKILATV